MALLGRDESFGYLPGMEQPFNANILQGPLETTPNVPAANLPQQQSLAANDPSNPNYYQWYANSPSVQAAQQSQNFGAGSQWGNGITPTTTQFANNPVTHTALPAPNPNDFLGNYNNYHGTNYRSVADIARATGQAQPVGPGQVALPTGEIVNTGVGGQDYANFLRSGSPDAQAYMRYQQQQRMPLGYGNPSTEAQWLQANGITPPGQASASAPAQVPAAIPPPQLPAPAPPQQQQIPQPGISQLPSLFGGGQNPVNVYGRNFNVPQIPRQFMPQNPFGGQGAAGYSFMGDPWGMGGGQQSGGSRLGFAAPPGTRSFYPDMPPGPVGSEYTQPFLPGTPGFENAMRERVHELYGGGGAQFPWDASGYSNPWGAGLPGMGMQQGIGAFLAQLFGGGGGGFGGGQDFPTGGPDPWSGFFSQFPNGQQQFGGQPGGSGDMQRMLAMTSQDFNAMPQSNIPQANLPSPMQQMAGAGQQMGGPSGPTWSRQTPWMNVQNRAPAWNSGGIFNQMRGVNPYTSRGSNFRF